MDTDSTCIIFCSTYVSQTFILYLTTLTYSHSCMVTACVQANGELTSSQKRNGQYHVLYYYMYKV